MARASPPQQPQRRSLPHPTCAESDFDRVSSVCCLQSEPLMNTFLSSLLDPALDFKGMLGKSSGGLLSSSGCDIS